MPTDPGWTGRAAARPAARPEPSHSLGLPDLPDLPDQFCGREAKDAGGAAAPVSSLHWKKKKSLYLIDKSGRSGSPREWLVSGRAAGRAAVGQQVGQRASYPATPPADDVSIR